MDSNGLDTNELNMSVLTNDEFKPATIYTRSFIDFFKI